MPLKSINPKNKQIIREFEELSENEIDEKISKAEDAFKELSSTTFADRQKWMRRTAEILRERSKEFAQIITDEVGKTITASEAEIEKCAATCDYYAENTEQFLAPEHIRTDGSISYARFDPLGVILAVMPWNFPFWQVFRFAAPALMAGNTGLLKHASNVQISAFAIEEVFAGSGFPEGSFLNLAVSSPRVESIIRNERIKAVTLTGSEKAGSAVAATAGQEIKKAVLELGGSDPFIVLSDADLDQAVEAAVTARFQFNAGQSCIAAKRFIVEEKIAEQFTAKLKEKVSKLKVGDPNQPETNVGPLVNEQMVNDLQDQLDRSAAMGAEIITGGKSTDLPGYYFNPAIITNLKIDMPVLKEETFGPIFAVITVKNADEAIEVANSSIYGLGSNIFTKDIVFAEKHIAPKIESGAVFINGPMKSDPRLPFGGIKKSGYGRELSHYGIKEFVNVKTIWVK